MIQISLSAALILYSGILGVLIFIIWVYTEVTVRRSYRILEKQFLWRCVFCGYIYLDEEAEAVSQCPRCESYNSTADKLARYVKPRVKAVEAPVEEETEGRNTSHRKRPHQRHRGPRRRR